MRASMARAITLAPAITTSTNSMRQSLSEPVLIHCLSPTADTHHHRGPSLLANVLALKATMIYVKGLEGVKRQSS